MPILVKFTPHHRVEGFRAINEGIEMAKILTAVHEGYHAIRVME